MKTFRIWWSPVDGPDGSMTIQAADKGEATKRALEEMRRCGMCGAYGAELVNEASE